MLTFNAHVGREGRRSKVVGGQTGVVARVVGLDAPKDQTGAELVTRHQLHLVACLFVAGYGRGGRRGTRRDAHRRLPARQLAAISEPFDVNGRLAIENLAHEHESHAWVELFLITFEGQGEYHCDGQRVWFACRPALITFRRRIKS